MKNIIIATIVILWFVSCTAHTTKPAKVNATHNVSEPLGVVEKFDVVKFNRGQRGGVYEYTDDKGNRVEESGSANSEYVYRAKLANPSFFETYKEYDDKTLIIKKKGTLLYNANVDTWTYYNKNGSIAKVVDEEKKFGKFGSKQLLEFLQKEGLINLKTGAGRKYLFDIVYGVDKATTEEIRRGNLDAGQWYVTYTQSMPFIDHTYIIDSHTGKIISHKNLKGEELVK